VLDVVPESRADRPENERQDGEQEAEVDPEEPVDYGEKNRPARDK